MTLTQVWGVLLIFALCPLLGGLPLIAWITRAFTGQNLASLGTGNVSVSAAFYHGGKFVGILAVLSEALKGIVAVLLARSFFPTDPVWEVIALIGLVMGRYWFAKGAGTTNVVWGYVVHDPATALLIAIIGGVGFTILRERQAGKLGVLVLIPLITALRYPYSGELIGATITLSLLLGWIYQKIPDDLDLPANRAQTNSRPMFRFFRGDRALQSLDQPLTAEKVGQKAATLSHLKRLGYPVPSGWVLPPGDDPAPFIAALDPSLDQPLVVRSSAIGEDSETASAAGQYESLLNITSVPALEQAVLRCQASYNLTTAAQYRQERGVVEGGMAVIAQIQIRGVFSGVAFSRDPIARQGDAVVVEALPGMASQVVSGQRTPEQYRVWISEAHPTLDAPETWQLPADQEWPSEGKGTVPQRLIQEVAHLARQLETHYHGVPQDIEWSYDGNQLWLLQARPITTLLPIWTRKIAAEVIPGFIHPLTWSINRPLTCGVWGDLFTLVLGERAQGLNFEETATLHHSAAYFNASLLGDLFRRMGLPPESLEFLTRGAKFSKPPLTATLRNVPGLLRLAGAEWQLRKDFEQEMRQFFDPGFAALANQPDHLPPEALLSRIQQILDLLKRATYYSILAPLSAALRPAILRVDPTQLDNSQTPEVSAVRAIQTLAESVRPLSLNLETVSGDAVFAALAETPAGQTVLRQFEQFLQEYGYLSEVGTDIAVPTWKEDPRPVQALFAQFLFNPPTGATQSKPQPSNWKQRQAQQRLNLKGRVTQVYSKLLAELRWSFVTLEQLWLEQGWLAQSGDIFFLTFDEIQQLIRTQTPEFLPNLAQRRDQLEQDRQLTPPPLVYGNLPPMRVDLSSRPDRLSPNQSLQGIPASPGQAEGQVLVLQNFQNFQDLPPIDRNTILVVPYTDSGWAALLARAGGLIAEVGGQLSHGAIVAREYGIPAVMNVTNATRRFKNGQTVRIDGTAGVVGILESLE
ncbi:MAG: pyruvate phosphate dikinase PEP/pyruvate-binding protein [Cyanobacteria bacterium RM1_2_2]|nr:pyruvate phosphate dikinase PEP/pyruvate-binding protein [Cyanobacteria bacterium RM1_2_2]